MIKVCYSELDSANGVTCRIEAAGHAGYAPAGQDIVCAGASILMQGLVSALAGQPGVKSDVWDEPDGPRLCVTAAPPQEKWVDGAFELAKAGFALLAERYPDNIRFVDVSRRGEQGMIDLQLFAEGGADAAAAEAAPQPPALSGAQRQQAVASGTMKPEADGKKDAPANTADKPEAKPQQKPEQKPKPHSLAGQAVHNLHMQWAREEALMRRTEPQFSLRQELKNPEMRRLMLLPGMRVQDAYRLAHYGEQMQKMAQTVEQGVIERIRQRGARPAENGAHPGSAAATRTDVAAMTRAQREALERRAMHGAQISF